MRYSLGTIPMSPFISPTHQPNMSYSCGKKTNRKNDNRRSLNSLTVEANQSSDMIGEVKSHRSALGGWNQSIYIDNLPVHLRVLPHFLLILSLTVHPYPPFFPHPSQSPAFCLSFQGQFKDTRPLGPIKITQENVNGRYISYEAQQICEPKDRVLFFTYRDRSALLQLMEKITIKIRTR